MGYSEARKAVKEHLEESFRCGRFTKDVVLLGAMMYAVASEVEAESEKKEVESGDRSKEDAGNQVGE